jgi:hypothetical protein
MQRCRGSGRGHGDRYLLSWIASIQGKEPRWVRCTHGPRWATSTLDLGECAYRRVQPKSGQRPNGKCGCLSPTYCNCCRRARIQNNRKVIIRYVHPRAGQLDRMRTARSIVIADELSCPGACGGGLELQPARNARRSRHGYRVHKIGGRIKAELGRAEAESGRQRRSAGITDLQWLKKWRRSTEKWRGDTYGDRPHIYR